MIATSRRIAGGGLCNWFIYGKGFEYWYALFMNTHLRHFTRGNRGLREYFVPNYDRWNSPYLTVHVLTQILHIINKDSLNGR